MNQGKLKSQDADEEFDAEETAHRRDEVIRRMANTPPRPRKKPTRSRQGMRTSTAANRVARKNTSDKES